MFVIKNLDDDETNSANYPKADQDEHLMMKMTESRMILMMMLRLMVMTMVLTPRMFSKPKVTGLFPSLSLQSWFVFPLRIKILQKMLL